MKSSDIKKLEKRAADQGYWNVENMLSVMLENKVQDGVPEMANEAYAEFTHLGEVEDLPELAAAYIEEFEIK